jgi:hypothetical protein
VLRQRFRLRCLAYQTVKRGNRDDEMDDAYRMNPGRGCFALADGASESSFAGLWANALAERFVAEAPAPSISWEEWLAPARDQWRQDVDGRELPYYAADKAAHGAFSTLLGFEMFADNTWQARAVGDSCLFHVRKDKLLLSFPLTAISEFGTAPDLLSSRTIPDRAAPAGSRVEGVWKRGDRFLLMTDALACWFLQEVMNHTSCKLLMKTLRFSDPAAFSERVAELRRDKILKNDDITLVIVEPTGPSGAT